MIKQDRFATEERMHKLKGKPACSSIAEMGKEGPANPEALKTAQKMKGYSQYQT